MKIKQILFIVVISIIILFIYKMFEPEEVLDPISPEIVEVIAKLGASNDVNSVAFSPDGKTILSGSSDNSLKLWNLFTDKVVKTLRGHDYPIESIAFSPDGKTALSGSQDNTVKYWDLSTGAVLKTLRGHSDWVRAVAFSPNGKFALSGSDDNTVKLWNLSSGRVIKTLNEHSQHVLAVAFSPDGEIVLSASKDRSIKLWNLSTGKIIKTLSEHSASVEAITLSPDGKKVLSASRDQTIKLWDLSTGRVIKTLVGHSDSVESVAFSPDGKTVLSGSADNTIKLWDLSTGQVIKTLEKHSSTIKSVTFSPDGKLILSASLDNTIRLSNRQSGEEIIQMVGFKDGEGVAITSQAYYVASANGQQYIDIKRKSNTTRGVGREIDFNKYKNFFNRPDIVKQTWLIVNNNTNPAPVKKRLALLIGNAAYTGYTPLNNSVNDANDLANVLRRLNFEVMIYNNLTFSEMGNAIIEFGKKLSENPGVGLFYFSGHGVQYQGKNYLIPVDATKLLTTPKQLPFKTVAASYIQTAMEDAGNSINLLILDACRNKPAFIKSLFKDIAAPSGIAYLQSTSGSLIAYAASPGGVAMDGEGRNSPYIESLIKWIEQPNLSITQILMKVGKEVRMKTKNRQSPGYYNELNDNFYFAH